MLHLGGGQGMKILLSRLPHQNIVKKQRDTNLPSQIEPVELQKNLYHHGHAATNKSKVILTTVGFTAPYTLPGNREMCCQCPEMSLLPQGTNRAGGSWSRTRNREAGCQLPSAPLLY